MHTNLTHAQPRTLSGLEAPPLSFPLRLRLVARLSEPGALHIDTTSWKVVLCVCACACVHVCVHVCLHACVPA